MPPFVTELLSVHDVAGICEHITEDCDSIAGICEHIAVHCDKIALCQ